MTSHEDPRLLCSLAYPEQDPAGRRELLGRILVSQAQEYCQGLSRRFGQAIAARSSGLSELLAERSKRECSHAEALGFPIPYHRQYFGAPDFDPVWPAAATALHLHALGQPIEFEATFSRPRALLAGHQLASQVARVQLCGGALSAWDAAGKIASWQPLERAESDALGVLIVGERALAGTPFENQRGWPEPNEVEITDNLRRALAALEHYAPAYSSWVLDVLRYVVPLAPPGPTLRTSHSVKGLAGVVFMSFPGSAMHTAETLVHECAHQIYHLAEEWFRLDNGRDHNTYHSHFVNKQRPIDRLLIAFHAFANIVLFYRSCLDAGAPFADECRRLIAKDLPHVDEFRRHLRASCGLTRAGRALCEPLFERVFA